MSWFSSSRKWILRSRLYNAAFFLIILLAGVIYSNLDIGRPDILIWFCNHTPLIFAIGLILNNKDLVKGIISVGLLPQLFWIVDFLGKLVFDVYVFDVTRYLFEDFTGISLLGSILTHLFSTIFVLLLVYRYKTKKIALAYSAVYLVLLFGFSLFLTPPEENINLIYRIEIWDITFPGYTTIWSLMSFILVVLPTHYFQVLLYKKKDTFLRKS